MPITGQIEELHVTSVEIDDRRYDVAMGVEFDGVEYVGHLWFCDEEWDDEGVRDQGAFPGRTLEEVRAHAMELSEEDLILRFRRAQADKRRYLGLRKITDEVLSSIRYLNKVATSMRAGLLDVEEAAAEIDSTERRLHEMIGRLRHFAGVPA
jgi:hypothetical protein